MKRLYYLYLYKWAAIHYKKKFSSAKKNFFENDAVQSMFYYYTSRVSGYSILVFFSSIIFLFRSFECNIFTGYMNSIFIVLVIGVIALDHFMLSKNKYLPYFMEFENMPRSWHKVTNTWFRLLNIFLVILCFGSALIMTKACF